MGCITQEYRCSNCRKLLFKGLFVEGEIDVKCKHCHELNFIKKSELYELLCLIPNCPQRITFNDPHPTT